MNTMHAIKRALSLLLAGLLAFTPMYAYPAFDPVNDDTDIFLANPNAAASRPNVLLIVDNTANWNTPFVNEKNALVQVFNGLNENFNVGLMMMAETGAPNDNVDGAYVRFHMRQTTGANRTALSQIVNGLDIIGDRSNNAGHGQALYEAYRYFGGFTSIASHGKVKTDKDGTSDSVLTTVPGQRALSAPANASTPYNSPVTDNCAKNFIILISNGPADNNTAELATMESRIVALTGSNAVISLAPAPTGRQGNWSDEMAKYMANADVLPDVNTPGNEHTIGVQNVITYVVEVNPGLTGLGPDWTAVMKSTATNGKGKYFGVTSDASGAAIVDALNQIFSEIQAVNSVFAATTLPVSVNVRGTNLNQVYIGVFRPDAEKAPRWLGNLKMYNLALIGGQVVLADAANGAPPAVGAPAANAATGFISSNAQSFWTQPSTYWGFRDASQNGAGGVSDSPDGDLVEKGGVAQQIRVKHPNAETPVGLETLRNIYTCTTGLVDGVLRTCVSTSSLSATPFKDGNAGITAVALQLDTRAVSPLSAFDVKPITTLTDRRTVTISNASAGGVPVVSLSQPLNTTIPLSSLTTATPKQLTSLTALQLNLLVRNIDNVTKANGANKPRIVTTSTAHGFTNGQAVTITGNSVASYNGTFTVSSAASNTFEIGNADGNLGTGTGGTATVDAGSTQTTSATATLTNHGYVSGQSVTITGASPAQFNGTFNITVPDSGGIPDPNRFQYTLPPAQPAGDATGTIFASGNTTTATATRTAAGTALTAGSSVIIFGASPTGYNGSKMVLASPAPTTTTFSYSVAPTVLTPNTGSPIYAVQGASTVAQVSATAHGFLDGQVVVISGSDIAGYNGAFPITLIDANTFSYDTGAVLPASTGTVTASTGTQVEVLASLANHGFSVGDQVVIEGGTQALHNGTFTVKATPTVNTFTYDNALGGAVTPAGSHTVRPVNSKVFATVTGHGYGAAGATKEVVVNGATPTAYNGTYTVTVIDNDTFTYQLSPLATAPGPNTSVTATASVKTMTARATSVAHGFADGSSVQIAGATPAAFNGTFTVGNVTANSFTYAIATAEGDASGTITATQAGGMSAERTSIIRWVRGEDNFQDENLNSSSTDIRASVHGDVLHSRPAVINYSRFSANDPLDPTRKSDDDVFVYYGANDGIFRAVKGGYTVPPGDGSGLTPGQEAWGFIPEEFFGNLKRLRNNSPIIGSSFKKPYFADGPIAVYTNDTNSNEQLGDVGDIVNLYVAMRRGGRLIYSLDVNNPTDPKFKWKITNATAGFAELGQTWSQTTVVAEGLNGYASPVLVFGGGYDPNVEDIPADQIASVTATSVTTTSAAVVNRTMGRAIYVVDAATGALIWSAGGSNSNGPFTRTVSGMDFAIPSDITVIKNESGGAINRAYVGDTGGNVWRIDFKGVNLVDSTVTRIASVGDHSTVAGKRKFLSAPDVVGQEGYDAILIGSGDREHPFDTSVVNRFYMFKDTGPDTGPVTGTDQTDPATKTIAEADMFDATTNCVQDCTGQNQLDAQAALNAANGWFVTLLTGEKVVGNAVTIGGTTFFATNQPQTVASDNACSSNLGVARQYAVAAADASSTLDLNASGGLTGSDRSQIISGGGYLPPPTHIVTQPTGSSSVAEVICTGVFCITPSAPTFNSRLRKFWYKEVDQR